MLFLLFLVLIRFCFSLFVFPAGQEDTTADRKDLDLLRRTLTPLAKRLGYRVVMSLANYKYAGTAALIRCSLAAPHHTTPHHTTPHHSRPHQKRGRTEPFLAAVNLSLALVSETLLVVCSQTP